MEIIMSGFGVIALFFSVVLGLIELVFRPGIFKRISAKLFFVFLVSFILIAVCFSFAYNLNIFKWLLLTLANGIFIAGMVSHQRFAGFRRMLCYWSIAFGIFLIIYQGIFYISFGRIYWDLIWHCVGIICVMSFIHARYDVPKNK